MENETALKAVFRETPNPRNAKRQARAARTRARALSPRRILSLLMSVPIVAASAGLAMYLRTSPYDPPVAVAHLIAMAGCPAAMRVGLAPAAEGQPGYHLRNDAEGDGVACGTALVAEDVALTRYRVVGSAKFIRP